MKNIHILPSDKPSRLYVLNIYIGLRLSKTYISKGDIHTPKNICITSDEELKDRDWCLHPTTLNLSMHHSIDNNLTKGWKKIILTTDPDLIEDGVQAIDDTFLEWFVKNPSCEEVSFIIRSAWLDNGLIIDSYQITIQKEEPRQEMPWLPKETFDKYHKLKQEKLEEVAKKLKGKELFKKSNDRARELLSEIKLLPIVETLEEYIERETKSIIEPSLRASAITFLRYGAKWQKEREKNKFSDEEMKNTIQIVFELTNKGYSVDEIFEQFKKK